MEYSSEKVMTRKEYLKSKRKGKFGIRTIKYILLLVVIVLLGIYLFEQLNIYNNVTKIANKVVEETALARTMTMYYLADGYTKDANSVAMLYKASDNSRTKIDGTEGFINIKMDNGKLYGLLDNKLHVIDMETKEKRQVLDKSIKEYVLKGDKIYFYQESKVKEETGIYVYDSVTEESKQLANITIYQMILDDNYIFVVTKGKTEKSIVRYNLNGSGRTVLSNKEIVTYIEQDKSNIYFIANDMLYRTTKGGKNTTLLIEDKIYVDPDIKTNYSAENIFAIREGNIYYINKSDETFLYEYKIETAQKQVVAKKNIESMQIVGSILYYKLNDDLQLYKVSLESGKSEKVTSIRGTEYICIN